ncbi:MAG: PDDEXK nuclease domain-containing protein [Thermodesulfobacteriota bacterium]|nr:PDDEXK nuclease domain-containing protein [Thermodesulfobacteriota bacterium]
MDSNQLSENTNEHYTHFLHEIKDRIRNHQLLAMRAVNRELVTLYWEIGKSIQQKQTDQGWGKAVVETLAKDLQNEFPGRNGFSAQNLWLMRQLFVECSSNEKLQPLVREVSWSKNLLFHRRLRCLVAIEIKIGDFKPEHKGKMELYLEALNTQERIEGENTPIGIASYSILSTLPEEYRNELPSPEEIARRLQVWENGNG